MITPYPSFTPWRRARVKVAMLVLLAALVLLFAGAQAKPISGAPDPPASPWLLSMDRQPSKQLLPHRSLQSFQGSCPPPSPLTRSLQNAAPQNHHQARNQTVTAAPGRVILGAPVESKEQRAAHAAVDSWLIQYFSSPQPGRAHQQHHQRNPFVAAPIRCPPLSLPSPSERGQFINAAQMRIRSSVHSRFTRSNPVGAQLAAVNPLPQASAKLAVAAAKDVVPGVGGESDSEGEGRRRPSGPPPAQRSNLIVVAAGDAFDASVWMNHPDHASYDIVAIHYGRDAGFACPLCKRVFRSSGPKWKLVYEVFTGGEWGALAGGYRAVMVADDDLEMDTCTLNSAFTVFKDYSLLLAQPSLCNSQKVHSAYKIVFQKPEFRLRYTTFVEIMAPIFDMDMFNRFIGPTLYNAHTGWGLDFVWPFLLKYPQDRIAVIDQVCIYHPHASMKTGPGLYAADAPYSQREEMGRRQAEWGYFESAVNALGYPWQPVLELGGYLRPPPSPPPPPNTLDRLSFWMASLLGPVYPVALLLQSAVIVGVLAMLCWGRVVRSRRRGAYARLARARSCPQVLRGVSPGGGHPHGRVQQLAEYPAPPFPECDEKRG